MATLAAQLSADALAPVAGGLARALTAALAHAHSRVRLAALQALDTLVLQVYPFRKSGNQSTLAAQDMRVLS